MWENGNLQELSKYGYSQSEIESFRQINYRELLMERGSMQVETLRNMGYTDEQIEILKSYDGTKITKDSDVLRATATPSGTYSCSAYGTQTISITCTWSWDIKPLVCLEDTFVMRWKAFDPEVGQFDAYATSASARAWYYSVNSGLPVRVEYLNVDTDAWDNSATIDIPMLYANDETWAKSGSVSITVQRASGTFEFDHVTFKGTYGHKTVTGEITINVTASSLVPTFTPAYKVTRYPFDDYLVYYNGPRT